MEIEWESSDNKTGGANSTGIRTYTVEIFSKAPYIFAAGYMNSELRSTSGGNFELFALVEHEPGDDETVEVLLEDMPTGVFLNPTPVSEPTPYDGKIYQVHTLIIPTVPPGGVTGRHLISLRATDRVENESNIWPYLRFSNDASPAPPYAMPPMTQPWIKLMNAYIDKSTLYFTGQNPKILIAGYKDRSVFSASNGGFLKMEVLVKSPVYTEPKVEIFYETVGTGVFLEYPTYKGENNGSHLYLYKLYSQLSGTENEQPISLVLELEARDAADDSIKSELWPYLNILP